MERHGGCFKSLTTRLSLQIIFRATTTNSISCHLEYTLLVGVLKLLNSSIVCKTMWSTGITSKDGLRFSVRWSGCTISIKELTFGKLSKAVHDDRKMWDNQERRDGFFLWYDSLDDPIVYGCWPNQLWGMNTTASILQAIFLIRFHTWKRLYFIQIDWNLFPRIKQK